MNSPTQQEKDSLENWYQENHRPLPWRKNRNPYFIWISETMLQQTTTTAVKPYFKNFKQKFPTLKKLAEASEDSVLEAWAGLGYYSRARNLHKAAKELNKLKSFPKTHVELIKLPGFGPYTSRSVSSIAFSEPVGVLDGNVIRLLSRKHGLAVEWWKTKPRNDLQELADSYVHKKESSIINQALMELGATICTPKSPKCILCPWTKTCKARAKNIVDTLPLKKPKAKRKTMVWTVLLDKTKNNEVTLVKNDYTPFLKNQWVPYGTIKEVKSKPKSYAVKHSITCYDIYVQIKSTSEKKLNTLTKNYDKVKVTPEEVKTVSPYSVIHKIVNY